MKQRYVDSFLYFSELANTSRKYYLDYLQPFTTINSETKVLEIGCGQGGNLLPFVELGCQVTGLDLSPQDITDATAHYKKLGLQATFTCVDFLEAPIEEKYQLILVHDVIEHVEDKTAFMSKVAECIDKEGLVFWRFPAWQMPFGGHQQICKNKLLSSLPFIHLLPKRVYLAILRAFKESEGHISELSSIRRCATSIERFERELKKTNLKVVDKTLWFINPHYEQKFKLKPRLLFPLLGKIKYLRNFFSTSCYYITSKNT